LVIKVNKMVGFAPLFLKVEKVEKVNKMVGFAPLF
jgi:hypothetical protein